MFSAVLAWSRVRFVRFAAYERAETTLAMLAECFEVLGGVPGKPSAMQAPLIGQQQVERYFDLAQELGTLLRIAKIACAGCDVSQQGVKVEHHDRDGGLPSPCHRHTVLPCR